MGIVSTRRRSGLLRLWPYITYNIKGRVKITRLMRVLWSRALSNRTGRGVTGEVERPETNRVGTVRGWENITERAFLIGYVVPPRARTRVSTTHNYSHRAEDKTHLYLFLNKNILHGHMGEDILGGRVGQLYRKKCGPCQLGKEKGNCSETMAKTGKVNSYSRVSERNAIYDCLRIANIYTDFLYTHNTPRIYHCNVLTE